MLMQDSAVVREITVNTGEVKCSAKSVVFLSRGVGSCIVLFIYDRIRRNGGVAHIMLPGHSLYDKRINCLYADNAVTNLVEMLKEHGSEICNLKAKIIGGANLFEWADAEEMKDLGKINIEKVKKELIRNKIYLAAEEVGGSDGKTVKCYTESGIVKIKYQVVKEKVI